MFKQSLTLWVVSLMVAGSVCGGTQRSAEDARAGRSDPTRPEQWTTGERQASVVLPVLSSVLVGGSRRLAVIDGRVMAEGEQIAGMQLRKVEADRVVLSTAQGARVTVHLDGNQVIKEVR